MSKPLSPFTQTPLDKCDEREIDLWVRVLIEPSDKRYIQKIGGDWYIGMRHISCLIPRYTHGECLSELLESELWPEHFSLSKMRESWVVWLDNEAGASKLLIRQQSPALAVCHAIITYAWEQRRDKK